MCPHFVYGTGRPTRRVYVPFLLSLNKPVCKSMWRPTANRIFPFGCWKGAEQRKGQENNRSSEDRDGVLLLTRSSILALFITAVLVLGGGWS